MPFTVVIIEVSSIRRWKQGQRPTGWHYAERVYELEVFRRSLLLEIQEPKCNMQRTDCRSQKRTEDTKRIWPPIVTIRNYMGSETELASVGLIWVITSFSVYILLLFVLYFSGTSTGEHRWVSDYLACSRDTFYLIVLPHPASLFSKNFYVISIIENNLFNKYFWFSNVDYV